MPKVKFLPSEKEVEAKVGDNLLKVSVKADVGLRYSCGGVPSCAMCRVAVVEGEEHLSKMEMKETDLLGNTYFVTKRRLACQTKILDEGDIVLDVSEHLESESSEEVSKFRKPKSEWRVTESEKREVTRGPGKAS